MPDGRFEDRVVLVTGAAGGLGAAIAREFADGRARLVLADVDAERLAAAATELGIDERVRHVALDLTAEGVPNELAATAREAFGRVDILINNAGVTRFGRFESLRAQDWDEVMEINLRAPFLLSQAIGRQMLDDGRSGAIVNIGSIGGRTANPQNIPYGVSKTALLGLTQQLAVEWAPHGIRVNAVNPGLTTHHMRALEPDADVKERQRAIVPLRRLVEPSDVAAAVAFLASPAARCITGVSLDVDGGYLLSLMTQLPRPERFL